jgi:hypothetical protein
MPTRVRFRGKIRIFVIQAVVFGPLAAFSFGGGLLYFTGKARKANGDLATDAGVGLLAMSLPMAGFLGLAAYQIRQNRWPLLRVCREGIEVRVTAPSSLDGVPFVPGLVRAGWLIVSAQGFRKRTVRIPWAAFDHAEVVGLPLARSLTIDASLPRATLEPVPEGSSLTDHVELGQTWVSTPLEEIRARIQEFADAPARRAQLESWTQLGHC